VFPVAEIRRDYHVTLALLTLRVSRWAMIRQSISDDTQSRAFITTFWRKGGRAPALGLGRRGWNLRRAEQRAANRKPKPQLSHAEAIQRARKNHRRLPAA
jgi:hypothetical protein